MISPPNTTLFAWKRAEILFEHTSKFQFPFRPILDIQVVVKTDLFELFALCLLNVFRGFDPVY